MASILMAKSEDSFWVFLANARKRVGRLVTSCGGYAEIGLSIPEVVLISGHKDQRMLFHNTHLRPETFLSKLDPAAADGEKRAAQLHMVRLRIN